MFYGTLPLGELLQTPNFTSDLIQRLPVKAWKIYHLNGAGIAKLKNRG